ncbi:multiheme c-type cytochrome [Coraliomargarita parva]|uniref:multiheme c-type cytochrome n=1 Tax=Coraliomargarita parva TaxID=3014050 RepID=UPI0022B2F72A|nr:multiheme c-type cytochrome [Coraliomargarita parva]
MFQKAYLFGGATALVVGAALVGGWTPVAVDEDPVLFMPGSQPGSTVLESIDQCMNCHSGYDAPVEPGHTWAGSMMAQAARDPLWLASVTVALQDSVWLLGNANAGDLCLRCHSPVGWLGGRSDPSNGTALDAGLGDYDGVNCSSCHQMIDPIAAERQEPWLAAETDPVIQTAADATYALDTSLLGSFVLFDNSGFYDVDTDLPLAYGTGALPDYIEASSGQYFMDPDTAVKRGNRHDAEPKSHSVNYSRFHKMHGQCAVCHDVSNAAMANAVLGLETSSAQSAASYFHVERTLSEFLLSAYGQPGGASTRGALAENVVSASSCQDCHMPVSTGKACNKNVPVRSDLRVHDLSGGGYWISRVLASVDASADNPLKDDLNLQLLDGTLYPGAVIDVAGLQAQGAALSDGADRALSMLTHAANLLPLGPNSLRVYNNTGHKLISGFPEGRRMWLNLRFYDASGSLIFEINPYTPLVVSRDSDGRPTYVSGAELEHTRDDLVFEVAMQSSLTGEDKTFHMALATDRYKDNRIPPVGFNVAASTFRLAQPRADGVDALDLFSASEYAGGYKDVFFNLPEACVTWEAVLYYQSTSKEYMEFLRDEINGVAESLSSPTPSGEADAYIAQSDVFFSTLADWGNAVWELWLHNEGAPPIEMVRTISPPCVTALGQTESGFSVQFMAYAGRVYELQARDELTIGEWTTIAGPVSGLGELVEFVDPDGSTKTKRFYRLVNELEE